jgi:hypothetical protein
LLDLFDGVVDPYFAKKNQDSQVNELFEAMRRVADKDSSSEDEFIDGSPYVDTGYDAIEDFWLAEDVDVHDY